MAQYFYSLDGTQQQGPLDPAGLRAAGVGPGTMVWCEGMPDWQPAAGVPELAGYFPPAPPPPPGPRPQYLPDRRGPGYPPVTRDSGTNGYAIVSLVCGVVGLTGWCCCPALLVSVLAVVFGVVARGQVRRGHGSGGTLASVGIILGVLGIAVAVLGVGLDVSSDRGLNWHNPHFDWRFGSHRK